MSLLVHPMSKHQIHFLKNINFCQTRDFLLPKLISGEIDVSKLYTVYNQVLLLTNRGFRLSENQYYVKIYGAYDLTLIR